MTPEDNLREQGKKSFEVKMLQHPSGHIEKAVFLDGVKLEYSINISEYVEAAKKSQMSKQAVQKDIEKHFTECVSDMIGRKVSIADIKKAILTGWI